MKQINPAYVAVFLLCAMGVWGCSQQRTGVITAKISELETRYAKLEEDYRTLQATHEQHRKKLNQIDAQRVALEKEKTDLNEQVTTVGGERDTLRTQLTQRTQERDVTQTNLSQFSKELQNLAGRVEAAANNRSINPNASIIPASRRTE
jgi:chromosome segregation ATPase